MMFVTDRWTPLDLTQPTTSAKGNQKLHARHWLFMLAVALLVSAPISWISSGKFGAGAVCVGLAMLSFGIATILVPKEQVWDDEKSKWT